MSQAAARPEPGDVLFVYSGGKDGFFNVWLQKNRFDTGREHGPWFSHVAVALDHEIALETSTAPAPGDAPTWSGSVLTGGVRIIAMQDLFAGSRTWRVLRSPQAAALPEDTFAVEKPYVSGVYGSQYSIQAFEEYVRSIDPLLALFSDATGMSGGWTSEATDAAHQIGEAFRERVLRDFPDHQFALTESTYYCSDLVRVVLSSVGLIPAQDRRVRITPSALFDLFLTYGFADVTEREFSPESVAALLESGRDEAKMRHDFAAGHARFWSGKHGFKDLWDVVEKEHAKVLDYLDEKQNKLFGLMGIGDKNGGREPKD
jgi:hypothetical protein